MLKAEFLIGTTYYKIMFNLHCRLKPEFLVGTTDYKGNV
jgi:hypothetical protein